MALLEKRFNVTSSDTSFKNEGDSIPPYFDNFNSSNWYSGPESYHYNIVDSEKIYIQYGFNSEPWVSAKFYYYTLKILNQVEKDNGEINATIEVQAGYFVSRKSTYDSGSVRVNHNVRVNNILKYSFSGQSDEEFSNRETTTKETIDIIVPPQGTNYQGALNIVSEYPDGEFTTADIFIGISLFNPNPIPPKTYIPMAIRKSNSWEDLDSNNGFIEKRVSGNWKDYSEEEIDTMNQKDKGHNRIRRNGNWLQLPKMNKGGIA